MDWLDYALPRSRMHEGLELEAYLCPAGKWTIGYGCTGPDVVPGLRWTKEQAEQNLRDRFNRLGARIDALVRVELSAKQMAALALLVDNIGLEAFRASTLLRLLNAGQYALAAKQFSRWVWATTKKGRVKLPGLITRRAEERALFEQGRS